MLYPRAQFSYDDDIRSALKCWQLIILAFALFLASN